VIPLRDHNRAERWAFVVWTLIAINLWAFWQELQLGEAVGAFVDRHGMVPARVLSLARWENQPWTQSVGPLVTHMFLHGGWMHLLGNLLFLFVFGDNIEGRLGHFTFLVFYLACGLGAAAGQALADPTSTVPMIGASGAIAGVLGAYLVLFPGARITTLIPVFIFLLVRQIPAYFFLGIWIALQVLQGWLDHRSAGSGSGGGVAWWAHVGGFVVGAAWMLLSPSARRPVKRRTQGA
jgi:membrane associated rhomboid family serine protease